jgi:hypothetical protein
LPETLSPYATCEYSWIRGAEPVAAQNAHTGHIGRQMRAATVKSW